MPRGAIRARSSYLAAQYHRIARRRGDKKAIVAVGHSTLVAAWHLLPHGGSYRELGGDYFDRLNRQHLIRYQTTTPNGWPTSASWCYLLGKHSPFPASARREGRRPGRQGSRACGSRAVPGASSAACVASSR
jgi:hypothetical protein